jgi:hypothetical protein
MIHTSLQHDPCWNQRLRVCLSKVVLSASNEVSKDLFSELYSKDLRSTITNSAAWLALALQLSRALNHHENVPSVQ